MGNKVLLRGPHPFLVQNPLHVSLRTQQRESRDVSLYSSVMKLITQRFRGKESRLPTEWLRRGGVLMPMHQAEAMWISFDSRPHSSAPDYPFAVKIATGKVCAVTGDNWTEHLNQDPQDYVVLPDQPWIDGYCVEKGQIRQFIAMPLGEGYTVEEQITGAAEHGGRDRAGRKTNETWRRGQRVRSVSCPFSPKPPGPGSDAGRANRAPYPVRPPRSPPRSSENPGRRPFRSARARSRIPR